MLADLLAPYRQIPLLLHTDPLPAIKTVSASELALK